jgi:hypothetical protein
MHHKHLIVAVITDSVLLVNHIAQRENVGNSFLIVPHMRMISWHDYLFLYFHGSTIAFQSHVVAGLESRFHQGWVTDQIHSGLTIQEYNLLEVKFDLGAMSLFEEFGNSWFKFYCHLFHLHLRELESIVKLKVRILFF